jgi:hypothetical protein
VAHLVFNLRNVPEDEADDIRQLLDSSEISYYETDSGNWGISVAAIWVKYSEDAVKARELIEKYENDRFEARSKEYQIEVSEGRARNLRDKFLENPIQFIASILAIFFILYISIYPFM